MVSDQAMGGGAILDTTLLDMNSLIYTTLHPQLYVPEAVRLYCRRRGKGNGNFLSRVRLSVHDAT